LSRFMFSTISFSSVESGSNAVMCLVYLVISCSDERVTVMKENSFPQKWEAASCSEVSKILTLILASMKLIHMIKLSESLETCISKKS